MKCYSNNPSDLVGVASSATTLYTREALLGALLL